MPRMEIAVILLFLLGLWLLVRWQQRQSLSVQPLARERMREGFRPGAHLLPAEWGLASAAAFVAALGFWSKPSLPPFSGRWPAVKGLLHALLGSHCLAWLCVLIGAACAATALQGLAARRRR